VILDYKVIQLCWQASLGVRRRRIMKIMFRIKICGITNEADACAAADAGADAIGLNFFHASRRHVTVDAARLIAAAVPAGVAKVGVFVNHEPDEIAGVVDAVGLDGIQLHGDEPAAILTALPLNLPIIRAFRCGSTGLAPLARYLDECRALGRVPDAVLLDADAGADFGGTGTRIDWARVDLDRTLVGAIPILLAGGLTPENVGDAIRIARPQGVDVASGVESQPGRKDAAVVREFVVAAREAFASP
jgi:phosphoribosylanthranilate isomerase